MSPVGHIMAAVAVALNTGVTVLAVIYPHLIWLPAVTAAITAFTAYILPGSLPPAPKP